MRRHLILICGLWLIIAITAAPIAYAQVRVNEQSLEVDGKTRWFVFKKTKSVGNNAPLVILLHGGLSNMHKTLARPFGRDWSRLAIQHRFMLIAPNGGNSETGNFKGKRQHWNDYRQHGGANIAEADDVQFIVDLVEWAAKEHGIDRSQVFVTGASNGGMMTYRLLQDAPSVFAGGAAFIANLPQKTPQVGGVLQTPLMIVNGTDDPLMKWDGGRVGARGQKDLVLSVEATRNWWLTRNNAQTNAIRRVDLPDTAPDDQCRLSYTDHQARPGGAKVRIMTMDGGGHAQPSKLHRKRQRRFAKKLLGTMCRDANSAALSWAFFTEN